MANINNMTGTQIFWWLVYAGLLIASAFLTAASFARSWGTSIAITTIVAVFIVAGSAFFWTHIVKTFNGYGDNKDIKIIILSLFFLFTLGISVASNTHNLYYLFVIEETEKSEFEELKNKLLLIKDKGHTLLTGGRIQFETDLLAMLSQYKGEVMNTTNPGHGVRADSIIMEIGKRLGIPLNAINGPRPGASRRSLEKHADEQIALVIAAATPKYRSIDLAIDKLDYQIETEKNNISSMLVSVEKVLTEEITDPKKKVQVLRKGYTLYHRLYEVVEDALNIPFMAKYATSEGFYDLPTPPLSEALGNIMTSWKMFYHNSANLTFIFSIILAFACDVLGHGVYALNLYEEDAF